MEAYQDLGQPSWDNDQPSVQRSTNLVVAFRETGKQRELMLANLSVGALVFVSVPRMSEAEMMKLVSWRRKAEGVSEVHGTVGRYSSNF